MPSDEVYRVERVHGDGKASILRVYVDQATAKELCASLTHTTGKPHCVCRRPVEDALQLLNDLLDDLAERNEALAEAKTLREANEHLREALKRIRAEQPPMRDNSGWRSFVIAREALAARP